RRPHEKPTVAGSQHSGDTHTRYRPPADSESAEKHLAGVSIAKSAPVAARAASATPTSHPARVRMFGAREMYVGWFVGSTSGTIAPKVAPLNRPLGSVRDAPTFAGLGPAIAIEGTSDCFEMARVTFAASARA